MKIIATSIVVLAAAATTVTAGESNLRLGRNLKRGNKAPRGGGMGYGARCCKDAKTLETCETDTDYTADTIGNICDVDGLGDRLDDFIVEFNLNGCVWTNSTSADEVVEVCEYADDDDDRRRERELAPGGKGKGKGNAKGIGFYCCRDATSAETCNTYQADGETVNDSGRQFDDCGGNVDKEDFNRCVWTDGVDGEEGECDHVDLDSSE